ncbi:NAD(P)-binding domain-containing protein [Paenibacillus agricola]|uniref:L-lysine N6-monooxygenase MbtG n=1 Tax=Paenibacillus agricola TaxID=2716264 RepID=A0ABX0J113_9BACL|nr:NAD(P)-binding domain-containing protein [Paenibacillus agricola]NHN29807.1 NAD(P)-binding domain-containing protein [Paenibacillus agricola]
MLDLIIIGAGPYGISLAAHASAQHLSYKLLGYPMHFWKNQMPQEMFIRTHPISIGLSDPQSEFTLERFSKETGVEIMTPLPRPVFIDYAFWFAAKTNVDFTEELATRLQPLYSNTDGDEEYEGYSVTTEAGQVYTAHNVIIATGLQHYAYTPKVFTGISPNLVSHTFGYNSFNSFTNKKVAVVGSGQSAWEAAALLHLADSDCELIYRRETPNYSKIGATGTELIELAHTYFDWPLEKKQERWSRPAGSIAYFLRPFVEGKIRESANVSVEYAETTNDGKLYLKLTNGEHRIVDHVIAATGFRIELDRVPFLDPLLLERIRREEHGYNQFPLLDAHFQCSLPGLYFAGPLSSHTHGPAFRFIAGLSKACASIIPQIKRVKALV